MTGTLTITFDEPFQIQSEQIVPDDKGGFLPFQFITESGETLIIAFQPREMTVSSVANAIRRDPSYRFFGDSMTTTCEWKRLENGSFGWTLNTPPIWSTTITRINNLNMLPSVGMLFDNMLAIRPSSIYAEGAKTIERWQWGPTILYYPDGHSLIANMFFSQNYLKETLTQMQFCLSPNICPDSEKWLGKTLNRYRETTV